MKSSAVLAAALHNHCKRGHGLQKSLDRGEEHAQGTQRSGSEDPEQARGIDGKGMRTFLVAAHSREQLFGAAHPLTGLLPLTLRARYHCTPHPCTLSPLLPAAVLLSWQVFSSAPAVKTPRSPGKCPWKTETLVEKIAHGRGLSTKVEEIVKIRSIKRICRAPVLLICQPDHFPEGIQEGSRCCPLKGEFWFFNSSWFSEGQCQAASSLLRYPGRAVEGKGVGKGQITHCAFMPAATRRCWKLLEIQIMHGLTVWQSHQYQRVWTRSPNQTPVLLVTSKMAGPAKGVSVRIKYAFSFS